MRMREPWAGQLEACRVKNLVTGFGTKTIRMGDWYVSGDISGGGTSQIVELFEHKGIGGALAAVSLPKDALVKAGGDDAGEYVAVVVEWAVAPGSVLPQALNLLGTLAAALEGNSDH